MPVFLSIVNMVGPNPRTMALMTTNCPESSEKTRDHSKINGEDVSLHAHLLLLLHGGLSA